MTDSDNHFNELAVIASLAATGDTDTLLIKFQAGLKAGISVSQFTELAIQLYAYAGFPRSLNTLGALMKAIELCKHDGYTPILGENATPLPSSTNKFDYGDQTQQRLIGAPVNSPLFEFAPTIDRFLKEHLFADIFCRGVLTDAQREVITVAVLTSLQNVIPQLTSHVRISLNNGVTKQDLASCANSIRDEVGNLYSKALIECLENF